jgi:sec-independent protein translocase protein TatB
MFGLTFDKLAIIAVIAVFLLGPERLPYYAGRLAALVRAVRGLADSAKARVQDELGPEFTDTDWKKLDPRQYDPRRIIREALLEDDTVTPADSTPGAQPPAGSSAESIAGSAALPSAATSPEPEPSRPLAVVTAPRPEHSMQRLIGLGRAARAASPTAVPAPGARPASLSLEKLLVGPPAPASVPLPVSPPAPVRAPADDAATLDTAALDPVLYGARSA